MTIATRKQRPLILCEAILLCVPPPSGLLDQLGHHPGPTRLMAGAQAGTVIAVEVFIEQDMINGGHPEKRAVRRKSVFHPGHCAKTF